MQFFEIFEILKYLDFEDFEGLQNVTVQWYSTTVQYSQRKPTEASYRNANPGVYFFDETNKKIATATQALGSG